MVYPGVRVNGSGELWWKCHLELLKCLRAQTINVTKIMHSLRNKPMGKNNEEGTDRKLRWEVSASLWRQGFRHSASKNSTPIFDCVYCLKPSAAHNPWLNKLLVSPSGSMEENQPCFQMAFLSQLTTAPSLRSLQPQTAAGLKLDGEKRSVTQYPDM